MIRSHVLSLQMGEYNDSARSFHFRCLFCQNLNQQRLARMRFCLAFDKWQEDLVLFHLRFDKLLNVGIRNMKHEKRLTQGTNPIQSYLLFGACRSEVM